MKVAAPPVQPQHARANHGKRYERDRKPALKSVGLNRTRFVNFYYLLCAAQSLLLKVSYVDGDEGELESYFLQGKSEFSIKLVTGHWLPASALFVLPHYLIKPAVRSFGFVGQFYLNRHVPDVEVL